MKRKVAIILNFMPINGISTVVINHIQNIDKKKFDLTIFSSDPVADIYIDICKEHNVNIIKTPKKKSKNFLKYYLFLFKELKSSKYDVVHVHGSSATIALELLIATMNGIKKRIAHCHSTSCSSYIVHRILRPLCNKLATKKIACSIDAGKWLYHKNEFIVLQNAFLVEKFRFDEVERKKIRNELNLSDESYVIGHMGRFNGTKNQEYLLNVFAKFAEKFENSYLLLVGVGPDYDNFKDLVSCHKYSNRIILFGETQNPEKIYSAMDVFAFPSKYEGLGIVGIEAQLSGLKCVASTNVPKEVDITNGVEFIVTDENNIENWVNALNKKVDILYRKNIDFNSSSIKKYKIDEIIDILEKIYLD